MARSHSFKGQHRSVRQINSLVLQVDWFKIPLLEKVETGINFNIVSRFGDLGLAQVTPFWACCLSRSFLIYNWKVEFIIFIYFLFTEVEFIYNFAEVPITHIQLGPQLSSVTQSSLTLCDAMDCSKLGLPVHHQFPEFTQTHVHWVGGTIQPSHPQSSPSLPIFKLSHHQGLFKCVSSLHQVAKVLEFQLQHQSFQWIFRTDFL